MTEKKSTAVLCPFCGAPYRKLISPGVLQLECQYCRGVFLVPPEISGGIPQCPNHFDRMAIGICNDCGESFCGECLHMYSLEARNGGAILYLCPTCLRGRHIKGANALICIGFVILVLGIVYAIFETLFGILFLLAGGGALAYGAFKRAEILGEWTVDELHAREEERKAEIEEVEGVDVEELYNELLASYISHWGSSTGIELLDSEIAAYLRHGVSFPEAVRKVYKRQKSKRSKQA